MCTSSMAAIMDPHRGKTSVGFASCRLEGRMQKERNGTIRENRLQFLRGPTFRRQPCLDVLRPEIDDAAIMARCGDVGRWLIGDRRKAAYVRLLWIGPV